MNVADEVSIFTPCLQMPSSVWESGTLWRTPLYSSKSVQGKSVPLTMVNNSIKN
jgi:hypothetical protein